MAIKATRSIMLKYAIKHPFAAFNYVYELKKIKLNTKHSFNNPKGINQFIKYDDILDFLFLSKPEITGVCLTPNELFQFYNKNIQKIKQVYGDKQFSVISLDEAVTLYFSILFQKPKIVVETGVSDGMSSLFILKALDNLDIGKLYSVDFPDVGMPVVYGKEPGWIVPEQLKTKWDLLIGKSVRKLPKLLDMLGTIDIFIHDSEHSYQNMIFEFNCALQHIHVGSLIISDDVTSNLAYIESLKYSNRNLRTGFLINSDSDFAVTVVGEKIISQVI